MTRDEERLHWLAVTLADLRRDVAEKHEALVDAEERRAKAVLQLDRQRTEADTARADYDRAMGALSVAVGDLQRATERADRLQRENDAARSAAGAACTGQTLAEALALLRRLANEATDRAERAEAAADNLRAEVRRLGEELDQARGRCGG